MMLGSVDNNLKHMKWAGVRGLKGVAGLESNVS